MLAMFDQKHLPDFGYQYMQFDDTYQQSNGSCPENGLNWNNKFPGGWEYSVRAIREAGMKPGIWVHRIHRPSDPHVKEIAQEHPDWFVRKTDGSLVTHHGFYMLDTTNREAVDNMVRKLYRGLKEQGWDYVKIDGTGDLLRAYQDNQCDDFFKTHPTTAEESLRKWDIIAREELGSDVDILACHTVGNARHVIGLVDGARLSNDGFQPRTLAQYNDLEGVVWRNDSDHCDVLGTWLADENATMRVFGVQKPVPARTIVRPAMDENTGMQVFAVREAREHPWVLSTTRHISQGGVSLLEQRWDADHAVLSGSSAIVEGDPYVLTVHVPGGFELTAAEVEGERVGFSQRGEVATVRAIPSATKSAKWKMAFAADE